MHVLAALVLFATASLHDQVVKTYDFRPGSLSEAAMKKKTKELDRFWADVKARGPAGLEELRTELRRDDVPPFFSYNGAKLLLSLSEAAADQKLAAASIARADLADLEMDDYFVTVHGLTVAGHDTTAAIFRILPVTGFRAVVEGPGELNQMSALMLLLLATDESVYVPATIRQLEEETDVQAQRQLLTVLAFAVDAKADEAIRRFANDTTNPEESRAVAVSIVEQIIVNPPVAPKQLSALRKQRRAALKTLTSATIEEVQRLSREMRAKKN